jgi:hypothetical protein
MEKSSAVLLILLFSLTFCSYGQLAIGYNVDGNTLCLSTNPLHKYCGEFRVNTKAYNQANWSYKDRGITQGYALVTIFSSEKASLYFGVGLGIDILSDIKDKWFSVNIPVGLKMNPFTRIPDLFLTGEYDPMIINAKDIPIIHCISLGFRFILSKMGKYETL